MNKTTSIYLDLVRFLAALTVFIVHANYDRFTGGLPILWRLSHLGNDAVMVFFVLSGFVIAYVANGKENNVQAYAISRFSRLYSVVFPTLILTVILDYYGSNLAFAIYDGWWYQTSEPIIRVLSNLFFVNELWFSSIRLFSNGPFWSIGYEFWYYVLFAIWFYLHSHTKYLLMGAVCLFVGPKILLLAPVWVMGVVVFRITSSNVVSEKNGWILIFASVAGYFIFRASGGQEAILEITIIAIGNDLLENLSWSKYFLSSYIIGAFIAINFIGFSSVSHRFAPFFKWLEKPIRYLASYTFILYLAHYPLLQFFSALTFDELTQKTQPVLVIVGTLISVWLLGSITERQKGNYKRMFAALWLRIQGLTNPSKGHAKDEDC